MTSPRILLVEDSQSLSVLYQSYLEGEGFTVVPAPDGDTAQQALRDSQFDLILLDLGLPDINGMDLLASLQSEGLPTPVVIITAEGSIDKAMQAVRLGAADFLEKPIPATRLCVTVKNVIDRSKLTNLVSAYERTARKKYHGFIGSSLAMQAVYQSIEAAASSKAPVFIVGESGTGKELCAKAVHDASPRSKATFVTMNCAAIPRDLMESQMFGHRKGAFTGAHAEQKGAAAQADKGTMFLDEVGEMEMDLQAKLLRFAQTGEIQRVGDTQVQIVDVRFVCATNRDPLKAVREGKFREDLYYRLHVLPIYLPPLRDRGEDVLEIADYFLEKISEEESKPFRGFSENARAHMLNHPWPGNVRELENVIRQLVVMNSAELVTASMFEKTAGGFLDPAFAPQVTQAPRAAVDSQESASAPVSAREIRPFAQIERETIENAIDLCGGDVNKAAAALEISASTIYRRLQQWRD